MSDNRTINDEELKKLIDWVGHGYGIDGPEAYQALRELQARRSDPSQARLSEAVKVLEEAIPLLDEAADKLEAEGMWGTSERDMAIRARQFLAILGEEK